MIQSWDWIMLREICACTASTSSINAGGEIMPARKMTAAITTSKSSYRGRDDNEACAPVSMLALSICSKSSFTAISAVLHFNFRRCAGSSQTTLRVRLLKQDWAAIFFVSCALSKTVPKKVLNDYGCCETRDL